MKKRTLISVYIILLFGIPLHLLAQNQSGLQSIPRNEELKSVSQARSIAFTNTLVPMATGFASVSLLDNNTAKTVGAITTVYGMIMGPSTGNYYAHDYGRGLAGLVVRSAGAYLMADATSEIFGRPFANALNVDNKDVSLTDTKILIGELLVLGSTFYNIISAKASVNEYNEGQGYKVSVSSTVVGHQPIPVLMTRINF